MSKVSLTVIFFAFAIALASAVEIEGEDTALPSGEELTDVFPSQAFTTNATEKTTAQIYDVPPFTPIAQRSISSPSRKGASTPYWIGAADSSVLQFTPVHALTDEFNDADNTKWNFEGDLNSEGCPKWKGPAPLYFDPSGQQARVQNSRVRIRLSPKPNQYWKDQEYYCVKGGSGDGYCNWDLQQTASECFHGGKYIDGLCRKHSRCLARGQKKYHTVASGQVAARAPLQYGFVEVRLRGSRAQSKTITAAWLSQQLWDPPYSTQQKNPSRFRGRNWQEIDIIEAAMASPEPGVHRGYMPNIHLFADYYGRHTARAGAPRGPRIMDSDAAGEKANELHLNPGSVHTHHSDWSAGFVTVGVWWDPSEIRFIFNGVEVARYKNDYIHLEQYIKLSLSANDEWLGGLPENSESAYFDYVRTWKVTKKGSADLINGTLEMKEGLGIAKPAQVPWPKPL